MSDPQPNATSNPSARQAQPEIAEFNGASSRYYGWAVWCRRFQFLLLLLAYVLGELSQTAMGRPREALLFVTGLVFVLVEMAVEEVERQCRYRGARAQEEFDGIVLGLPWNRAVAGERLDRAGVHRAAEAYYAAKPGKKNEHATWYTNALARLPLTFARIAAQMENSRWDRKLRTVQMRLVGGIFVALVLAVFGFEVLRDRPLTSGMLVTVVAAVPFARWLWREFIGHLMALEAQESILHAAEEAWSDLLRKPSDPVDAMRRVAEIQAALFVLRSQYPGTWGFVYKRLKPAYQRDAQYDAERAVEEAMACRSQWDPSADSKK